MEKISLIIHVCLINIIKKKSQPMHIDYTKIYVHLTAKITLIIKIMTILYCMNCLGVVVFLIVVQDIQLINNQENSFISKGIIRSRTVMACKIIFSYNMIKKLYMHIFVFLIQLVLLIGLCFIFFRTVNFWHRTKQKENCTQSLFFLIFLFFFFLSFGTVDNKNLSFLSFSLKFVCCYWVCIIVLEFSFFFLVFCINLPTVKRIFAFAFFPLSFFLLMSVLECAFF